MHIKINKQKGNSLSVQWFRLHTLTDEGLGSVPGWGTRILQTMKCSQKTNFVMHIKGFAQCLAQIGDILFGKINIVTNS